MTPHLSISELQHIRLWHVAHRAEHPLEYHLWDSVLTLWMMGWIGWLPTWTLDVPWASPLCLLCMMTPNLYVGWRARAHAAQRLKCDWLPR